MEVMLLETIAQSLQPWVIFEPPQRSTPCRAHSREAATQNAALLTFHDSFGDCQQQYIFGVILPQIEHE
eukprot:5176960-Amphidinium_carterae.1